MRAIILAAGIGSRFNGEIKALLPICGEALVQRLIRQLRGCGISPVYVVCGYRANEVLPAIHDAAWIYDPDFAGGRNSTSLKVALDTVGFEDTLMLDADVLLTDDLLPKLVGAFRGESISLVDLSVRDEEAMKIVLADERIVRYSKDEGSGAEICTIVTKEKMREIYEDLATGLYKWWGVGPHTTGFKYVNVNPESRWFDIDTSEEYASAKKIFETVT